ncbi:MAG: alpha/beta hydrolase [Sphingomonadales bacterium]|nr:alpha/beta hydrolase [Sphingomonadales bacterium]
MSFPQPQLIKTNGIEMAVYEARPDDASRNKAPPIVMCHGFPELAFSWRHQLPALKDAGYHVLAPDQRGYGLSSSPDGVAAYHAKELVADLVGMLDAKGIEKAIFCGHDWGSLVMWAMPFYAPERLAGLISLNVPFIPRRKHDPITLMNARFGKDNYINFFQSPDAPEQLFEADIAKTFRFFMRVPESYAEKSEQPLKARKNNFQDMFQEGEAMWPGKELLNKDELEYFTNHFANNGFNGPINWYRNFVANWQDMERFQPFGGTPPKITLPTLMILAENDPVLPPVLADGMEQFFTDLKKHLIKNCGHWTQQEKPQEVNEVLIKWLADNYLDNKA